MANVALLATIADAKASQATQTVSPVMPTGVILPYGGNTAPAGWLVCDGAEYSQTTYADLFAALGSTYNTQLNPVTGVSWTAPSVGNFRVPDMRGMFMRGEGTPSGLDAVSVGGNQVDKTKPNSISIGASSASVSGLKNQLNSSTAAPTTTSGYKVVEADSIAANKAQMWQTAAGFYGMDSTMKSTGDHTHSFTYTGSFTASGSVTLGTITGDNETRPMNRGVKYIIKV